MALAGRFLLAYVLFGWIFLSYMSQLGLLKIFRRWVRDPGTGREVEKMPAWLKRRQDRIDASNARRLLRGMLRLHGVYIKLGQVLSVLGGMLPQVYAKELEQLQDAVPPKPFDVMKRAFVESLGKEPEACFVSIETIPIAAASLGQVHVAFLADGRKVAVKILYPGIRDVIRIDMRVIRIVMRVYRFFVPVENIMSIHDALVDLLRRETDYLHEASCMEKMAANFADEDDILFPEVVHELTTREVLTMTFMDGTKISRVDEMDRLGIDRRAVASRLIQCFYKQIFVDRFFHADPHPGNFLFREGEGGKPHLVVLDFGAVSEVGGRTVDGMIDILRGLFEQNDRLVLQGIETIGFVAPGGNRALLEATVKRYFEKLLRVKERTAGALMRANAKELEALADPEVARLELRELMRSVRYPDGWFYVERASVMVFWLAARIDPDMDTMQVGFPYVMPLLAKRIAEAAASPSPAPA